jgi:hypothetical protein
VVGSTETYSQRLYRIRANVSIKEKLPNGKYRLTVGLVYYDKLYGKTVYKLTFPRKETLILQDTTVYRLDKQGNLMDVQRSVVLSEFTIFHLALTNRLSDFGLKNNTYELYKMTKVEKVEGKVLSTWMPAEQANSKYLGKILMSNTNKRLEAIAIYGPGERLLSRQFFRDYIQINGLEFPTQVTQMAYSIKEGVGTNLQQTTYSNVVIDQNDEDEIYRHPVPVSQRAAFLQRQRSESAKPK